MNTAKQTVQHLKALSH